MASGDRRDPLRNFRFRLEIDSIQQAGFSDVTGFDSSVEPIDYREGTDEKHVRKLPGITKYSPISLKWGITDSMDLYNWHLAGVNGAAVRKNVAIIALDEAGNDKARWEIKMAWPSKYKGPDFNAKGNDVAIETMELVHEGIVRIS